MEYYVVEESWLEDPTTDPASPTALTPVWSCSSPHRSPISEKNTIFHPSTCLYLSLLIVLCVYIADCAEVVGERRLVTRSMNGQMFVWTAVPDGEPSQSIQMQVNDGRVLKVKTRPSHKLHLSFYIQIIIGVSLSDLSLISLSLSL